MTLRTGDRAIGAAISANVRPVVNAKCHNARAPSHFVLLRKTKPLFIMISMQTRSVRPSNRQLDMFLVGWPESLDETS